MNKRILLMTAWVMTLLVSVLPNVILAELFKADTTWLFAAKLVLLAAALLASLLIKQIRPLWMYFTTLMLLYLAEYGAGLVGDSAWWKSWFPASASFTMGMLSTQLIRLMSSLFMVAVMLVLKRRFAGFYLVKGSLSAQAAPIPVLMNKPESWKKLGVILSVCITGGTLLFLVIAGRPSLSAVVSAAPMFPMILLLAVMNSFSEEMSYRAAALGALDGTMTGMQAVMLAAVFFGIGHYYGVPYGIVGVVMAWFLGWLLGKSMHETKGFTWAWFIHFLQDVAIFSFMAIGAVTAGGK